MPWLSAIAGSIAKALVGCPNASVVLTTSADGLGAGFADRSAQHHSILSEGCQPHRAERSRCGRNAPLAVYAPLPSRTLTDALLDCPARRQSRPAARGSSSPACLPSGAGEYHRSPAGRRCPHRHDSWSNRRCFLPPSPPRFLVALTRRTPFDEKVTAGMSENQHTQRGRCSRDRKRLKTFLNGLKFYEARAQRPEPWEGTVASVTEDRRAEAADADAEPAYNLPFRQIRVARWRIVPMRRGRPAGAGAAWLARAGRSDNSGSASRSSWCPNGRSSKRFGPSTARRGKQSGGANRYPSSGS